MSHFSLTYFNKLVKLVFLLHNSVLKMHFKFNFGQSLKTQTELKVFDFCTVFYLNGIFRGIYYWLV